jgi:hypothetical protein
MFDRERTDTSVYRAITPSEWAEVNGKFVHGVENTPRFAGVSR